jgi:xylulokinase
MARGVAAGWSDFHTAAHFRRAIMEGIALEIASLMRRILGKLGASRTTMVLGGGGATSDAWCQLVADVLDLRCIRPATVELTSLGAALCAVAACECEGDLHRAVGSARIESQCFDPVPGNVETYRRIAAIYAEFYGSTKSLCNDLARFQESLNP